MQQLNSKTHTVFWILIKCLIQYCDNLDRSILSHWTPCLVRKMGCNTWRVLLRKNIRNRHLTVWWCMMQHAHVSSTYVIIHYLEYNCESPSSTYGGPTRSAVRHSSVTPIICSYQINVSKFQVADHAAHLCRCFDWGPTARRIFFLGPWEKKHPWKLNPTRQTRIVCKLEIRDSQCLLLVQILCLWALRSKLKICKQ